jgi:PTH1 family peptidyl-tRNA hydrolase
MKFLIAGLGNMHIDYFGTRHNVGFEVVDELAGNAEASWSQDTHCHRTVIKHKGHQLILIKPTTYMNLSGKAVRYWLTKEKLELSNLLIVLDDLNIEFGSIRLRAGGSDGGHNGLKDIDLQLATNQYPRLRVGIGANFSKGRQVNYVLGKWSESEAAKMPEILKLCADTCLSFCAEGMSNAMNKFNAKKVE